MANITLSISDEIKKKMDAHPHIKWSNAIRTIILQKLEDFETAEKLAKKGGLTEEDIEPIVKKVNKAMAKKAEELLDESYRRR